MPYANHVCISLKLGLLTNLQRSEVTSKLLYAPNDNEPTPQGTINNSTLNTHTTPLFYDFHYFSGKTLSVHS